MKFKTLVTTMIMGSLIASQALAWGDHGHRMIGEEAMRALPSHLPAFLRTPLAIASVGEFSREPDRWRNSGKVHDSDRNAAHFVDLTDEGKTFSGHTLDNLPGTRFDFDAATRAAGSDPWKSGYLPYALVDAYQQVVKDMAQWRVLSLMETRETDKARKAWYRADRLRREQVMLRDIGILSHYVGDSTNPMHLSIHYNGWGDYPNPKGYTNEKVHGPIEADFVSANLTPADVRANMGAPAACTARIDICFADRLMKSWNDIEPMYATEKEGGFKGGDPRGKTFLAKALGKGAADLRDVLTDAWRDSKTMGVGYPVDGTTYDDFVGNKVDNPCKHLHGE